MYLTFFPLVLFCLILTKITLTLYFCKACFDGYMLTLQVSKVDVKK